MSGWFSALRCRAWRARVVTGTECRAVVIQPPSHAKPCADLSDVLLGNGSGRSGDVLSFAVSWALIDLFDGLNLCRDKQVAFFAPMHCKRSVTPPEV
jgi:hypothetical protein